MHTDHAMRQWESENEFLEDLTSVLRSVTVSIEEYDGPGDAPTITTTTTQPNDAVATAEVPNARASQLEVQLWRVSCRREGQREGAAVLKGGGGAGGGGGPLPVRPVVVEGVLEAARVLKLRPLLLLLFLLRFAARAGSLSVGARPLLANASAGSVGGQGLQHCLLWCAGPMAAVCVNALGIGDGSCGIGLGMLAVRETLSSSPREEPPRLLVRKDLSPSPSSFISLPLVR
jgi:hypothetical protein